MVKMKSRLPKVLTKFDDITSGLYQRVMTMAVYLGSGIAETTDPRIDDILKEMADANARLDRISSSLGHILQIQMDEFVARKGNGK